MQFFDQSFAERFPGVADNHINAFEVIGRFDHIIHIDNAILHTDGVGFIDIARLVMGQAAALHVIGVIGKVDLDFVVDSTFDVSGHFILQNIEQGTRRWLLFVDTLWTLCILRNVPCLADKNCTRNLAGSTVVADSAL